jgi:hypothetical protein
MLMGRGRGLMLAFFGAPFAFSGYLHGESVEVREKVRISYDVPSTCPVRAFYEARVQTRLQGDWLAPDGELARLLRVTAITHGAKWYASLDFEDAEGRAVTRTVKGATCEEAVAAIALVTALAIEAPGSEIALSESAPPPSSSEPSPAHPRENLPSSSRVEAPLNQGHDVAVPRPFSYEIGASFLRTKGVGPGYANGVELFFGISTEPSVSLARVGFSWFDSGVDTTEIPHVEARARTVALRFQSCPFRLDLGRPFSLPFCAGADLGLLHVRGSGSAPELTKGRSAQVFWFVPSLSPRLRGEYGAFFIEVGPEFRLYLTQRQFSVRYADRLVQAFETPLGQIGFVGAVGTHF